MDQLKDLLRQCVKYRFWIAFGVSLILPIAGYFVGVDGIVQAKNKSEGDIKKASGEIGKFKTPGIVNAQYQPLAAQKNIVLTEDVDDSWRKLRSIQEPFLKWPEEVEAKFLLWGRKYPTDVDSGEVTRTLVDYTFVYPGFVSRIYKLFKPFNYEDGTGIVAAPDESVLLKPAKYSSDSPPDLTKVWAEQERLWVVTALLDAIARINDTVKAKDWDGAIVKEIKLIDVGSQADQDQKSMAEGVTLVPADALLRDGAPAPVAPTSGGTLAAPGGGPGMGGPGGGGAATDEVYYLKNDAKQFKTLPIKITVLVDQAKLPDFLVGLENSPITTQVLEVEVSRPVGGVTKPVLGDRSPSGGGLGGRMGGGEAPGGTAGAMGGKNMGRGPGAGPGTRGPAVGGGEAGMPGMMGGRPGAGPGGGAGAGGSTKGVDGRSVNKAQIRKDANKEASKTKAEPKVKVDQYYNIVEVTVYGQARFYLAPPPRPTPAPSTAVATPTPTPTVPEVPKVDPAKGATPAPGGDVKKDDPPKADEPSKPETSPPKGDEPKAETPKSDPSKPDAPKTDPASGAGALPKS